MECHQNHPTAPYELSQLLDKSDNSIKRREGFNLLQKAADYQNPEAMLRYGKIMCGEYDSLFGSVSKIDRKTALTYLKAAADAPDSTPTATVEYAKQLYLQSKQESSNSQDKEIEQYFLQGIDKSILTCSQSAEIIIPYVQFLVDRKRIDDAVSILKANKKLQDASLYYWLAYCGVNKVKNMKLALCTSFAKSRAQDVELESIFNMNTNQRLTENDLFPCFNTPEDEKQYFRDIKMMYTNNPDDNLAKFKYAMLLFSGIGTDFNVVECMHVLESFSDAKLTNEINGGIKTLALKLYSQWILNNIDDNEKEFQIAELPMKIWKEIADANDIDCQFLYAWKRRFGSCFVVADKDEGMRYLEMAAKSGH